MFSKTPTPDFSPRPRYVQAVYTPPPPPQKQLVLPEKIIISESAKLPIAPPPPIITHQAAPVVAPKLITLSQPQATPLAAPPVFLPTSAFSPSLETFTGKDQSYFKLSSAPSEGANWWQFPAGGNVDMSGNSLRGAEQVVAGDVAAITGYIRTLSALEVDTKYISCAMGMISSFSTSAINLDGATLTTAGGTELLLNGIPVATTSNISSLSDWSLDPAISTLNMNGNPILGASDIEVSSINGGGISSFSAAYWSAYPAVQYVDFNSYNLSNVSTINSLPYPPPASGVTSLNAQTGTVAITSAGNTVTVTNPTPGTINLETAAGSGAASWANFPAISTVLVPNQDFNMSNTAGGLGTFNTARINANVEIGALSNAPFRPTFNAYPDYFNVGSIGSPALGMTFTSLGGVNINSALGVSLAGGGGVAITGVGGINLQGGGAINVASGGILVSGGGIAITAGGLAVNGGGLLVAAGGMSVTGGEVTLPSASTIMGTSSSPGGEMTMYGNNIKLLPSGPAQSALLTENIGSTSFTNTMRISGVSTINNVPFPPPIPGLATDLICSTLVAANYVSTPTTYTNNITGTGVIIGSTPGQGITIGTNATEVNMTADVAIRSPYLLSSNELTDCVQASVSTIINLSTINAAPYNLGTANDTIPAVTCWGTANAAQTLANNAQINAGVAQATANTAILQSGTVSVAGATGAVGVTGGTGISVTRLGNTITINASGAGPTGATGPPGQSSSYFKYQAQTSGTTPSSGHITWQTPGAQTTSTYIQASHINNDGVDVELFLSTVVVGNTLIIQNQDDSTNFQKWLVSGTPVIVPNNYVQYPITLISSAGPDFTNNHKIILAILSPGPQGPTGPTGPVSTALVNRVIANSVGIPTSTPLTWSAGSTANQYVPLAADTQITYRPPTAPATGTGWRFTKTYALITVATSGLTTGSTYTIVTPGIINWTAIGAAAATAGTQFTYNGVAITGTGGTATENSKISWYAINALYGLSLPQTVAPVGSFSKANLQSAWFLVKFNADIALQGSLAIQIDTYAYQYTGNTTNSYTGRWAYSFPLQQAVGFNVGAATNITAGGSPGLFSPRLRSGFTYLLYAGDYSSFGAAGPLQPPTNQYLPAGSGLFAPSQTLLTNTLRDPYDIYPEYPHFGLTSCLYSANATQPPYGGANPYSDQAAVEVASIYLNTSSTAPYSGTGQTVTDFQVLAMGFTSSTKSLTFPLSYV